MKTKEQAAKEYADSLDFIKDTEYLTGDRRQCFLAGVEFANRWVSVEEELPEDQGVVMVKTNTSSFATAYLHGASSGFITYGESAYLDFGLITHWKPIE